MKKNHPKPEGNKKASELNIGYENTKKSNDGNDKENNRLQTTDTGHDEGPKENEDDTKGLRSESGSKSLGKATGNKEGV